MRFNMKDKQKIKQAKKQRRQARVRAKVFGTSETPRLAVYKSLGHIYAQVIDDTKGTTLAAASDLKIKQDKNLKSNISRRVDVANLVGKDIAAKAKKVGITKVVYDRGGFKYHGRIKALAEGAREAGLEF
jgi:large subunit ribosomal protein L18